jgi:hypothetical protein
MQLAIVNAEKQQMLNVLLEKPKIEIEVPKIEIPESVKPKLVTWNMRRQMLEAEDREKAKILRQKAEETAKLEKELGVNNAQAVGGNDEKVIQPRSDEKEEATSITQSGSER